MRWNNLSITPFVFPATISGPYGQYTVEAVIDASATFSSVPAPALIEMGIEPVRLVRLAGPGDKARFAQLGRALTTVAGQEDITPVLFGEPGEPCVIGAVTLSILLLRVDDDGSGLVPVEAQPGSEMR